MESRIKRILIYILQLQGFTPIKWLGCQDFAKVGMSILAFLSVK